MKADQSQEAFATTISRKLLGYSRSSLQTVSESEFEGNQYSFASTVTPTPKLSSHCHNYFRFFLKYTHKLELRNGQLLAVVLDQSCCRPRHRRHGA